MAEPRAITLTQPWASLMALGAKRMETRSWQTSFRGPVLIHAGKSMPCRLGEKLTLGEWTVERDRAGLLLRCPRIRWPYRLPQSAVVAVVDLFEIRSTTSLECEPSPEERALGDFGPGRYAWSTSTLQPLSTPVPASGAPGPVAAAAGADRRCLQADP